MTWFFLSPTFLSFDRYCRHQMQGISMAPRHPLSEADLMAAAKQPLPLSLRFHNLRTPIAAGLGTIAVGSALLTALPHSPNVSSPMNPTPLPVMETIDTLGQDPAATAIAPQESETSQAVPTPARSRARASELAETLATDSIQPSESPTPVVVKKILRKRQQTVIIQDTTKQ